MLAKKYRFSDEDRFYLDSRRIPSAVNEYELNKYWEEKVTNDVLNLSLAGCSFLNRATTEFVKSLWKNRCNPNRKVLQGLGCIREQKISD
jgi:hypothetical protein